MNVPKQLAEEISVKESQVTAAVSLLDEGSTVPFIARYRKEVTGGLDDAQLRQLEERLRYLRQLEDRRDVILKSIAASGKLTPELEREIAAADTKTRLEDLYLPFKPKRRTKAQIAREAGLEPLADALLQDPRLDPQTVAAAYVCPEKGIGDVDSALEGARSIAIERFAEDAQLVGQLRENAWEEGKIRSVVARGKKDAGVKFSDYFDYSEPLRKIAAHRVLALLRGRNEKVLKLSVIVDDKKREEKPTSLKSAGMGRSEFLIASRFNIAKRGRPADEWLVDTVRAAWSLRLHPHLEVEAIARLRETAEAEAIRVFAGNLHDLLLAAPAGPRTTIGLDPGLRTGVKVAVVDGTGKLLDQGTIYPHVPHKRWDESIDALADWARRHTVELLSIGNGTASRETDALARDLMKRHPELKLQKLVVSEAGASVYSASEVARAEFPDLDVSLRGAVSIARRLQDPLAELVKIEPRSIGVGQYQHDVAQTHLDRSLDAVVEDCVNAVGVDVNMASAPLLTRVSGLNKTLAQNIVAYRNENGPFPNRDSLKNVPRLGNKAFQQTAGFLRIANGTNPLDGSSVHPEAYPVVQRIVAMTRKSVAQLIGESKLLRSLDPAEFTDETFGVPTVTDILKELEKPGRDPRPEYVTAEFKEGVATLEDLKPGMVLEGVVTNVTNFGAFIDVGVHQDGLAHISELADKFVSDPRDVVKAGQVVRVRVVNVDVKRRRIGLTLRNPAPG